MPGYQLSNFPQQLQRADMPDYLRGGAPIGALKGARRQLGQLFDFDPIQQTGNQFIESNFRGQQASVNAAARAAQNRAMLSGGRVGASFAGASAMLPLYNQKNEMAANLARLQATMNSQRAGLLAQIAQGITGAQLQNRGMLANYGLGQQRLQQDESQFGRTYDLQRDQFDADQDLRDEQLRALRLQNDQQQTGLEAFARRRPNFTQFSPGWGGGINPSSLWNA